MSTADSTLTEAQVVYVKQTGNGFAVAGMVLGLVGLVFGLIPILFFIAWALGTPGLVLAIAGRRKARREPMAGRKTMATWGVVLSFGAIAMGIVGVSIVGHAVNKLNTSLAATVSPINPNLSAHSYAARHMRTIRLAGNGGQNLGTINVPAEARLTWHAKPMGSGMGAGNMVIMSDENGMIVNAIGTHGTTILDAGTYHHFAVNAETPWKITIKKR